MVVAVNNIMVPQKKYAIMIANFESPHARYENPWNAFGDSKLLNHYKPPKRQIQCTKKSRKNGIFYVITQFGFRLRNISRQRLFGKTFYC